MELGTPRLHLREFRDSDFEAFWEYQGREETHRYEKGVPTEEATSAYLRDIQAWAKQQPRTRYVLAVTIPPNDRVIGHIKLTVQNPDIREWEIGWYIHSAHWGKGYATEAASEMLNFAFNELRAHRVIAFCNAMNLASARVMQKLGMQQDGHLREALWWNGRWVDEYLYAILDREW